MEKKRFPSATRNKERIASADRRFSDYRERICRSLAQLFDGDEPAWETFQTLRSSLRSSDRLAGKFAWEDPFMQEPWPAHAWPLRRKSLCQKVKISSTTLASYERLGLIPKDPEDCLYAEHQAKRLQWVLFFLKELRISAQGLIALLNTEPFRTSFETLARSAPPCCPVHLSPPSKQAMKRVTYREGLQGPSDRTLRDHLHDMGNRIHVIAGRAALLKRKMGGHALCEKNLTIILGQAKQAETILSTLMKRNDKDSRKG